MIGPYVNHERAMKLFLAGVCLNSSGPPTPWSLQNIFLPTIFAMAATPFPCIKVLLKFMFNLVIWPESHKQISSCEDRNIYAIGALLK